MKTLMLSMLFLLWHSLSAEIKHSFLNDDLIDFINSLNTTWKAGHNFHSSSDIKFLTQLAGDRANKTLNPNTIHHIQPNLPTEFDSRIHWPHCPTIREIRDQGSCGSCWAFAAVECMSDRICIHSSGQKNFHFSAQNLISCCQSCGNGCNGASHRLAWDYWVHHGIVSGGSYNSQEGCQPYEFPPCEHHEKGSRSNCTKYGPTPSCSKFCQPNYKISYQKDLNFGKTWYSVGKHEKIIMTEILNNGPVEASMTTYEDFYIYKSGVYQHIKGRHIGSHAIKIIGWGTDSQSTPYWLVANSFNVDWGDNGYFKIKRGTNECDCENDVTAGIPQIFT